MHRHAITHNITTFNSVCFSFYFILFLLIFFCSNTNDNCRYRILHSAFQYSIKPVDIMLKNCICFKSRRRSSMIEDSSSCRSSEIERGTEVLRGNSGGNSFLKFCTSKLWCREWRKPGRGMSMTRVERSKYFLHCSSSYFSKEI